MNAHFQRGGFGIKNGDSKLEVEILSIKQRGN